MPIIKIIITAFLLPPGSFILILVCYSAWSIINRKFHHGLSFMFIGLLAWALSISPVSDAMLRPLETEFKISDYSEGDVIILLGAGVHNNVPDLTGYGVPSRNMLPRIIAGIRLQKELNLPLIVSGRGNDQKNNSTKAVLIRYLSDLGVSRGQIIIENKSKDTFENARYSSEICKEKGFKNPILITAASHMKRSVLCFKREGYQVIPFPVDFYTWNGKKYKWKSFLPDDYRKSSIALHEYFGLLFYRVVNQNNLNNSP